MPTARKVFLFRWSYVIVIGLLLWSNLKQQYEYYRLDAEFRKPSGYVIRSLLGETLQNMTWHVDYYDERTLALKSMDIMFMNMEYDVAPGGKHWAYVDSLRLSSSLSFRTMTIHKCRKE